ncbi:hypothetical protein DOS84_18250 [Flavobacterium aquariorum]|uniref:Uncharacterized protein n=1 Tax=Flavobacterium aquariorum TaxID=2217670 RepID=A0A2W7TRF6_9FLAO|nr:hypothetical protein [Flavobacterium aquariorum]PZX91876.1 hypothetical protein DOS84_18250 [Flavobacterium aquariorum]
MTRAVKLTWLIITLNILIATIMILVMFGVSGFMETIILWPTILLLGILGLYISGFYVAQKMDKEINIKHQKTYLIGIPGLLTILIIGTFIGSTMGFIQFGISEIGKNHLSEVIFDYYIKLYFWVFFFGIIPTLITGFILGKLIKNHI